MAASTAFDLDSRALLSRGFNVAPKVPLIPLTTLASIESKLNLEEIKVIAGVKGATGSTKKALLIRFAGTRMVTTR